VALVVKEMLTSGHWLRPTLLGSDFASYPPFFYWCAGLLAYLFQPSELFLRLPSVLAAGVLLAGTYWWIKQRSGPSAAFRGVIVLGSTYLFFQQAIHIHVDMVFAAMFSLIIFAFDGFRRPDKGVRLPGILLAGLAMGLASLTKGPLGILLPGAILTLDSLIRERWLDFKALAASGLTSVLVFGAWSFIYASASGTDNLLYFFWHQNVDRFLESASHQRPIVYYLLNFPLDALPWTPFVALALFWSVKRLRQADRQVMLPIIWFVLGFIFFSLASSKRSVYLLPLYPAVAALVGIFWAHPSGLGQFIQSVKRIVLVFSALFFLAGAGTLVAPLIIVHLLSTKWTAVLPGLALTVLCTGSAALIVYLTRKQRILETIYVLPLMSVLGLACVYGWLFPILDHPLSARADAKWLNSHYSLNSQNSLGIFSPEKKPIKEATAVAFYGHFSVLTLKSPQDIKNYMAGESPRPIVVKDEHLKKLQSTANVHFKKVKKIQVGGDRLLVLEPP
jgi:4-amino-4-deoxy-L-arabinose transferase-like glycosyltransferase